nr:hypothetical protein StreXyl84_24700 [Streptomyces sp. Xyl84]
MLGVRRLSEVRRLGAPDVPHMQGRGASAMLKRLHGLSRRFGWVAFVAGVYAACFWILVSAFLGKLR